MTTPINTTTETTTNEVDTTYVDPNGVRYVLELNPEPASSDDEATVTQHRDDRTRTVATGPTEALRAMLATWAETEGGDLTGPAELVIMPRLTVAADYPADVSTALGELAALAPMVETLAERIATTLAPPYVAAIRADVGDQVGEVFGERTGWNQLYAALMDMAGHLHAAASMRPDSAAVDWYDQLSESDRL